MVWEFIDIFSTNLPGISPERDIDFSINLLSDTKPISIPPYHMSHAELQKLSNKLGDLLGKGIILDECISLACSSPIC